MATRNRLRIIAALAAAAYAALVAAVASGWSAHAMPKLLAGQFGLLLPAAICYLLSRRDSNVGHALACPSWLFPGTYILLVLTPAFWINPVISCGDESAYMFQSRIFASGRFAADPPPVAAAFQHTLIYNNGWFGKYPPGWPAALTIAGFARATWMLNPLLGLLILWLAQRIAWLLFDGETAMWTGFLLIASPFFILNCLGYMSHTLCSALIAGASWFYFRGAKSTRTVDSIAMLALLTCAFWVRPYTAL